jgi:hypothetical protein
VPLLAIGRHRGGGEGAEAGAGGRVGDGAGREKKPGGCDCCAGQERNSRAHPCPPTRHIPQGSFNEINLIMEFKFAEPNVMHLLFTPLLEYRMHGESTRPNTTVVLFEDLSAKGIVLMRGEFDPRKPLIGLEEARTHVQKLRGADPESERGKRRRQLIEALSIGSLRFDVNKLMEK